MNQKDQVFNRTAKGSSFLNKTNTVMKNKVLLFAALLMLGSSALKAQMNIGSSSAPNANAALQVTSSTKGILYPLVALTSTTSFSPLSAHVVGMMVFNTATTGDVTPGPYYNDGTKWIAFGSPVAAPVTAIDCSGTLGGTYATGSAMTSSNTKVINFTTSNAGYYPAISVAAVNGVSFSAPGGTASSGSNSVTLTASGTPTASGTFTTYSVTIGSQNCSFSITYTTSDAIYNALSTNQSVYTAASTNTWVQVTASEYSNVLATVIGATVFGEPASAFAAGPASTTFGASNTLANNTGSSTALTAGDYPIAMKFGTTTIAAGAASGVTAQLKFGTSGSAGYTNYIGLTSAITTASGGIYYFVIKKPSAPQATTGFLGLYVGAAAQATAAITFNGVVTYNGYGNVGGTLANSDGNGYHPLFQVLGTATKSW